MLANSFIAHYARMNLLTARGAKTPDFSRTPSLDESSDAIILPMMYDSGAQGEKARCCSPGSRFFGPVMPFDLQVNGVSV